MNLIHHSVVSDANTVSIQTAQFLGTGGERILGKSVNGSRNAQLDICGQALQAAQGGWLELNDIRHSACYNPSFFLTSSQGMVPGSARAFFASSMSIRSSSSSRYSAS